MDALRAGGSTVTEHGNRVQAQCPAHEDRSPSLSLTGIEGQVLVYCHAGCPTEAVVEALGLSMGDLFDEPSGAAYEYTDQAGNPVRTVHRSPAKRFRQSGVATGMVTLYRLPRVIDAIKTGRTIYVVEGEKDVHAIESVGAVATTGPMGASNWPKVDTTPLHGGNLVVVVDRDDAGHAWGEHVAASLGGHVSAIRFVQAREGKDAADHIAAGHGLGDFVPVDTPGVPVPARRGRVTWASEIEPEPVVWAWAERIPAGSLSVAAGREGTGKSSFGIWLAAQITNATLPGSLHGTPRRVLYVAVEDSWKHTLVPRLMAAKANLGLVGRFDVLCDDDSEVTLSLPVDNALLEDTITAHGVGLVVIDPLMSVIGERIDTHRERDTRQALDPLARIADRTGAVILGIAHFNKGTSSDAASLITGSGAFKNVPRSVFGFARDEQAEDGTRVITQVKNSLGREDLPSLTYVIESATIDTRKGPATTGQFTFTGESDRTISEILRDSSAGTGEQAGERHEASVWLVDYLIENGGEAPAGQVIKAGAADGIAKTTLTRARDKAGVTSRKSGYGGGWVWTLEPRRIHQGTEESSSQGLDSSVPSVVPSQHDTEPPSQQGAHIDVIGAGPRTPAPMTTATPQGVLEGVERVNPSSRNDFDYATVQDLFPSQNTTPTSTGEKCSTCGEPVEGKAVMKKCRSRHRISVREVGKGGDMTPLFEGGA